MVTNSEIIARIIKSKGYKMTEVANLTGEASVFFSAYKKNRWTTRLLKLVGGIIGVDLTMYANSVIEYAED